jgi:HJR/Mrr/RecB family endonuclease
MDEAAVMVVDIAGFSAYRESHQAELILALNRTFGAIDERHSPETFYSTGDGAFLLFSNPDKGYSALKQLVRQWLESKSAINSPLLLGLRIALDQGPTQRITPAGGGHDFAGMSLNVATRLSMAAEIDSVILSERIGDALAAKLKQDGISWAKRTYELKHGQSVKAILIPLAAFAKSDQFVVRLAPSADIIMHLAAQPDDIYRLPPRKFEEVIAEIMGGLGFAVELTKQTRDDGIDIIAVRRSLGLKFDEKYLIECKRYAKDRKVDVGIVRGLLGVGETQPHTGLIIATTSQFTKPAIELATREPIKWKLALKDYFDIKDWIQSYSKRI